MFRPALPHDVKIDRIGCVTIYQCGATCHSHRTSAQIIARIGHVSDVSQLESLIDRIPNVDSWEKLLQGV